MMSKGVYLTLVTYIKFDLFLLTNANFIDMYSSEMPIYFINPDNRKRRHEQWQQIVKDDEEWWNGMQDPNDSHQDGAVTSRTASASSVWDPSKSAVLGMATKYHLDIYES